MHHPALSEMVLAMRKKRHDDATRVQAVRKMAATVHAADGGCVYCGSTKNLTIDHVLPLRLGGTNDPDNLASACKSCNSRKGGRTPEAAGMKFLNRSSADRWAAYKENNNLRKMSPRHRTTRSDSPRFRATRRT